MMNAGMAKKIDPSWRVQQALMERDGEEIGMEESEGELLDKIRSVVQSLETAKQQERELLEIRQEVCAPDAEVVVSLHVQITQPGRTILELMEDLKKHPDIAGQLEGLEGVELQEFEEALQNHCVEMVANGRNDNQKDHTLMVKLPVLALKVMLKEVEAHMVKPDPQAASDVLSAMADEVLKPQEDDG